MAQRGPKKKDRAAIFDEARELWRQYPNKNPHAIGRLIAKRHGDPKLCQAVRKLLAKEKKAATTATSPPPPAPSPSTPHRRAERPKETLAKQNLEQAKFIKQMAEEFALKKQMAEELEARLRHFEWIKGILGED